MTDKIEKLNEIIKAATWAEYFLQLTQTEERPKALRNDDLLIAKYYTLEEELKTLIEEL